MMIEKMKNIKRSLHRSVLLCLMSVLTLLPAQTSAQGGLSIIRDTEIENTLREWLSPLLTAAGIGEKNVNIILVQSPDLNAFVAGGANIFVYTGLIDRTENPGELIGVLAHELGHIAGGHLIATRDAIERASYESILGAVLGIGAALATGNGGAASAVIAGSSSVAQRRFLAHSRVHESSADQAALRFMSDAHLSPKGLVSFFRKLESEELLPSSQQSEYIRTHPLTRNRIDAVETKAAESPYYDTAFPDRWVEQHARMKAKLAGFIKPQQVLWIYNEGDDSIPARYAYAIADYRGNNISKALERIDALLEREPDNPYFLELKGQMLVEFGRVGEALSSYEKSVALAPNAGLIRIAYGHALIESGGGEEDLRKAVDNLERALQQEPRSPRARRLLATAYGRLGDDVQAQLNLAEEAILQREIPYAKSRAEFVVQNAKEGSREWLQAKDLLNQIENTKL